MADLTEEAVQQWLVDYMAALLDIPPDEVDVTLPFESYGLDSTAATGLSGDLSAWLGIKLDPSMAFDYPTISAVARHVVTMV